MQKTMRWKCMTSVQGLQLGLAHLQKPLLMWTTPVLLSETNKKRSNFSIIENVSFI